MAIIGLKRMSTKADTVQVFQVIYQGSKDHAALLDIYVNTADPALIIKVGRPGCGLDGAQDTAGRAKAKIGIIGDHTGATELPEGAGLVEYVSQDSVASYIMPRLMPFLARVHGQSLTA